MQRYQFVLATLIVFLLTACSGNKIIPAPVAPVFSSTPVTQAEEATPYTYQLAASGAAVTFSLTNAPAGATLSGSTVSWTPTAQQSRVPNSFTVTATASGGASATQSWTVTPSGTIRINWVDTYWNETGSTDKPFNWTPVSSFVAALVPQPDGSFKSFFGAVGANGAFEIPSVPAGYYWLRIAPRGTYWTSSSTFDMGTDLFSPVVNGVAPTSSTTYFNFSFTSLDPTATSGLLQFDTPEWTPLHYSASTNPGSTTFVGAFGFGGNLDFSLIKNAFVRQYEPATLGSVNAYLLGPTLTLSNLSLTTGGHNTISGALNPTVPASLNLSIKGSAWAPLFDHIAPTAPTTAGSSFALSVQPYIASDNPKIWLTSPISLIWTKPSGAPGLVSVTCSTNPPLTSDVEAGTVQYSDPFPSAWRRTFSVCQSASVAVPVPGGKSQNIILTNTQTTLLPTMAVKPLISPVQNPKINGADLFTTGTINSAAVTISWDPPAVGTPFGYDVAIMQPITLLAGTASYTSTATLSTAKTSMTIPPDLLKSGQTYLFVITSLADGRANMETSPHRSSLPSASAQLISAPITAN
ncbi:MAG TPA: putative Ig domain-containing protein [Bryobacteraceae bacterium]